MIFITAARHIGSAGYGRALNRRLAAYEEGPRKRPFFFLPLCGYRRSRHHPPMAQRAIFLIGMMGSGKSTIGRALARELDMRFVDCDRELEVRSGVSITTMFEVEGEQAFREREAALIEELTQRDGIVLATGGGAVLSEASRAALRGRGLVIYLRASVDELARRTARDRGHPCYRPKTGGHGSGNCSSSASLCTAPRRTPCFTRARAIRTAWCARSSTSPSSVPRSPLRRISRC